MGVNKSSRILIPVIILFCFSCGGGSGGHGGANSGTGSSGTSPGSWTNPFDSQGGMAFFPDFGLTIEVPENAILSGIIRFRATPVDITAVLPADAIDVSGGVKIDVDGNVNAIRLPMRFTLKYKDEHIPDEKLIMPMVFKNNISDFDFLTLLKHDELENTIHFVSTEFETIAAAWMDVTSQSPQESLNDIHNPFMAKFNEWSIPNSKWNFIDGGGICFGMSAYCTWYYRTFGFAASLYNEYAGQRAQIIALRSHLEIDEIDLNIQFSVQLKSLYPLKIYYAMKKSLKTGPLILIMDNKTGQTPRHAGVLTAWSSKNNAFYFYDVNDCPYNLQTLPFDPATGLFGAYKGFDCFCFLHPSAIGLDVKYGDLYLEGFNDYQNYPSQIFIHSHDYGEEVEIGSVTLEGYIVTSLNFDFEGVQVYTKGIAYPAPHHYEFQLMHFKSTIPIIEGYNEIFLFAGRNDDTKKGPASTCSKFELFGVMP